MVSVASANATVGFAEMVEETCGITAGQWTDGFVIQSLLRNQYPFEIGVFRMADEEDAAEAVRGSFLEKYLESLGTAQMDEDMIRAICAKTEVFSTGQYLAYYTCEEHKQLYEALYDVFTDMKLSEMAEAGEVITPAPEAEPIPLGAGVSFIPVNWKEPKGDPDPDHPGRIKFTMPENDPYMTLYDTAPIVAAWQSGDPSSLSEYDRAIYNAAKEVLDEIIQPNMTDFEKEAEIYNWVLQNIDYAYVALDVLRETDREAYTPYGGLVNHDAVCLGYAATFQLLTELSGIEGLTVIGAGHNSEEPHGWAMVKLNGEWYCTDPTWDWSFRLSDMISNTGGDGEPKGREWHFFNTTSDYMARTGHQWDYDSIPEATAEDHGWQ